MKANNRSFVLGLPFPEIVAVLIIVSVCCCLPRPVQAQSWENVTVINTMGWQYPNVTVEMVPGESAIMLINSDGARKKLPFSSVRAILDPRGKDITNMVITGGTEAPSAASGAESVPPEQQVPNIAPPTRKYASPAPPVRMQGGRSRLDGPRYRVMLTGDAGYGFPTGDWFEGFTSGFQAGATMRVAITNSYYLGFGYKRQWLGVEDELKQMVIYDDYGNPYVFSLDWNVHLDEYMFILGWMSSPSSLTTPFAYVDVGFGAVTHVLDVKANFEGEELPVSTDETKFGMVLAVGGTFPMSAVVGLNLEGDMRITGSGTTNDYYTETQSSTGIVFGFRIGLAFLLGGGQ